MRRRLIILFAFLCVVGAGLWSIAINHRTVKADTISTILSGSAYGLSVNAANGTTRLSSGPFGEVSTVCNPEPVNQENTTSGISLFQGLLVSSVIQDKLTSVRTDEQSSVESTSTIEHITLGRSLLGPLIEVEGLHAVARSTARIGDASSTTGTSFFGRIKIAGLSLPLAIAPNTRISLPGLGTIVLNEQIVQNRGPVNTYAEVNMVDITLGSGNILRQPIGTRILIGHSVSSDSVVSMLAATQAHAFGLYTALDVNKLAAIQSGPLPDTEIGCMGGTNSARAVELRVGRLADTGVAETQTTGVISGSRVAVSSSEKIVDLNLLGGLIQAGLLEEDAHAIFNGSQGTSYGHFNAVKLSIGGTNLPKIHPANDRINLRGLGYVMIDEIVPSKSTVGFAINALDISITVPNNSLHLAVGLHIIVGHVDAGISIFH